MTLGRRLDPNTNDIGLVGTQIGIIDGIEKTTQTIKTNLLSFLGEWFLDTTSGVDYFGEVFIKPVNLDNAESVIKTTILQTQNVDELIFFDLVFNSTSRGVIIQFEVTTVDGTSGLQEVNLNV